MRWWRLEAPARYMASKPRPAPQTWTREPLNAELAYRCAVHGEGLPDQHLQSAAEEGVENTASVAVFPPPPVAAATPLYDCRPSTPPICENPDPQAPSPPRSPSPLPSPRSITSSPAR